MVYQYKSYQIIMEIETNNKNVQKIRNEIKQIDVKEVVKLYFLNNFEEAEIDTALKDIDFVIRAEEIDDIDNIDDSDDNIHAEKIQDWIKRIFRYLLSNGHGRYWQTPIGGYYICSQWWKPNDRKYDLNIKRWLSKVMPDYIIISAK